MKDLPADSRLIELHDGRHVGMCEFGLPEGNPVVFCHGFPSSRLGAGVLDKAAREGGSRLISLDRPGIGLSSPKPGRLVSDWVEDLREVMDELSVRRFSVLGAGRGTPYAFAAAALLPNRVQGLAATSLPLNSKEAAKGRGWFLRYGAWLGKSFPFLHAVPLSMYQQALLDEPREGLARILSALPQADRQLLSDETARTLMLTDVREAFRQGLDGPVDDAIALENNWGFRLEDIRCSVQIWKPELDGTPADASSERRFAHLPGTGVRTVAGRGPLGVLLRDGTDILRSLAHA